MDLGLSGRTCVVTGASRGIGRETARQLAAEGAAVLLVARSEEALVAAADDSVPSSVLVAAGRELAVPDATIHEVEAAGLLVSDADTVGVRHPLVRAAVYQAATGRVLRTYPAPPAGGVDRIARPRSPPLSFRGTTPPVPGLNGRRARAPVAGAFCRRGPGGADRPGAPRRRRAGGAWSRPGPAEAP